MDPLSVTSGIVGIVAFAFQLAKTASKVKSAIEEVKSAPKEARELIERLVMLETACQLVGLHLERRETLASHSSSPSLDIISKALAQCLPKVQELEQMLSKLSSSDGPARISRSKFDTVSRLRLVLRKDKISSLVQEIDRVISLLQFVIQVDMWAMSQIQLQPPSLPSHGIKSMDQPPNLERTSDLALINSAPYQSSLARNNGRATHHQRRTFRYLGYITWTVDDSWIGDKNDDVTHVAHRKGRITFRLPFTSTQLRMHYDGGMGTPSCALNVTQVIDRYSELGRRLFTIIRPNGDPEKLRELISSRELSIYSVYRFGSLECNLFFMAVGMRWAEGCRYLLQHDFRHKFREDETPECIFSYLNQLSGKACEVTETVLSVRPHDMQEKDIKYLLDTGCEPEYFGRYLTVFLKSPMIDHSDLLSWAWGRLVGTVFTRDEKSSWIPAFRILIEQGVDIHQPGSIYEKSAYTHIVGEANHPFEADDRARSWLKILKACAVDLDSYLEAETTLIEEAGFYHWLDARKKKMVMLDFDGLPMPSWRWEVPTESSISEVVEEFLNLGSDRVEPHTYYLYPAGPDDIKAWKAENYYSDSGQSCFPFLLSPIDLINGENDYMLEKPWCRETYNGAVELRDKRFARRQAKKWRKAHPGEKAPSNKMPGTWVD